jgi:low temperature requirement protein LtrA
MSTLGDAVEEPVEAEVEVTPLELLFDLIFVVSLTQVTRFVSDDASWTRLVEGLGSSRFSGSRGSRTCG